MSYAVTFYVIVFILFENLEVRVSLPISSKGNCSHCPYVDMLSGVQYVNVPQPIVLGNRYSI